MRVKNLWFQCVVDQKGKSATDPRCRKRDPGDGSPERALGGAELQRLILSHLRSETWSRSEIGALKEASYFSPLTFVMPCHLFSVWSETTSALGMGKPQTLTAHLSFSWLCSFSGPWRVSSLERGTSSYPVLLLPDLASLLLIGWGTMQPPGMISDGPSLASLSSTYLASPWWVSPWSFHPLSLDTLPSTRLWSVWKPRSICLTVRCITKVHFCCVMWAAFWRLDSSILPLGCCPWNLWNLEDASMSEMC